MRDAGRARGRAFMKSAESWRTKAPYATGACGASRYARMANRIIVTIMVMRKNSTRATRYRAMWSSFMLAVLPAKWAPSVRGMLILRPPPNLRERHKLWNRCLCERTAARSCTCRGARWLCKTRLHDPASIPLPIDEKARELLADRPRIAHGQASFRTNGRNGAPQPWQHVRVYIK